MNSMKHILACSFVIIVVYCSCTSARPMAEDSSENVTDEDVDKILRIPIINAHVRTYARKRHAEIRLSSEIGRRMAELKRIQALNQLMADLDTSKVYTVQNNTDADKEGGVRSRQSRHQLQSGNRNEVLKVYPTAPSNREIAPELLKHLNGQTVNGGVKIRIVTGAQTVRSPTAKQFQNYVHQAKNAVAVAKTCKEMQEMMAHANVRLRIRCQSTSRSRVQKHRHN